MSPSATPATQSDDRYRISTTPTQSEGRCHQVPRLPRQQPRRQRRQTETQARHQSQSSAISATPATQSEGRCHQVPRLPQVVWWVSCVSKLRVVKLCVRKLCVDKLCVSKLFVVKLCGDKLCVCVNKLCVVKLCWSRCAWVSCVNKLCVVKLCMSKLCVSKLCVDKLYVMSGRAAVGGEKAGVQNQKQEPHTKMWGTNSRPVCWCEVMQIYASQLLIGPLVWLVPPLECIVWNMLQAYRMPQCSLQLQQTFRSRILWALAISGRGQQWVISPSHIA